MPTNFSGTLDFEGEPFTVKRLVINEQFAALDAVAYFNGSPWAYSVTGQKLPSTANIYEFRAPCKNAADTKPTGSTRSDYILRVKLTREEAELDVDGEWWEASTDERYTVSGLLEETPPPR